MECEYCGVNFDKWPVKKVLRGKKHTFCSETCFNFFFYKYPKHDLHSMYHEHTVLVSVPDIQALIEEE